MWQRLSAVRIFIEHMFPSQDGIDLPDVQHILELWKVTFAYSADNRPHIYCISVIKGKSHSNKPIGFHLSFLTRIKKFYMYF